MHNKKTSTATIAVPPRTSLGGGQQWPMTVPYEPALQLPEPRNRHELRRNRALARKAAFVLVPTAKAKAAKAKGRKR